MRVNIRRIHHFIGIAILLLCGGAALALVAVYALGFEGTRVGDTLWRLFHLDAEGGFPAIFSFLLILAAASVIWICTWTREGSSSMSRYKWRWRITALVLAALAFDEAVVIHEAVSSALRQELALDGLFRRAWVVPYGLGALVLAGIMIAPLRMLPRRVGLMMLIGGGCYVLGAAGVETMGSALNAAAMSRIFARGGVALEEFMIVLEELMEMVGMWIFLAGGMSLMADDLREIHVEVK